MIPRIFGPGGQGLGDAGRQTEPVGCDQPFQYLLGVAGQPAGEIETAVDTGKVDVDGELARLLQGE
ncbi:DUF6192 family protein [Streptomyces antarcticus]|uniref:DUF6192 family protein n=1 Tax=Streptomyces antarcticus TaxID=2996458 RepID=UPI00226DD707|nr:MULTISPECIES: DUF6192 family protein [unclassified Streptomyces]MCY0946558.1 DUF6192 family protein [Streptomyces sp. H34-AA3]MCZ4086112.1 DUF6192 family protein [Streptomyces sp. H34-S5]